MRTIELSKARGAFADYARGATGEPLIVTEGGKPLAALVSVQGVDLETLALSSNSRFIAILEESRRSIKEEGGITTDELKRRLGMRQTKRKKK